MISALYGVLWCTVVQMSENGYRPSTEAVESCIPSHVPHSRTTRDSRLQGLDARLVELSWRNGVTTTEPN